MYKSTLASEMIESVRDGLDEFNIDSIKEPQILKALNRAQRSAVNIIARKYEDAFLEEIEYTADGETKEVPIPEACFGGRVEMLEYMVGEKPIPMRRITFRQATNIEAKERVGSGPYVWYQKRNILRVLNGLSNGQKVRIWFTIEPEKLVEEQGRITLINTTDNRVTVNSIGDDLTTEADNLNNYVNIVDAQTGDVKCSLQISAISGNKIYFKSSPDRTTVFNRPIDSAIDSEVELDDYVCISRGSCISSVYEAYVDYLVEKAVVTIKRSIGEDGPTDYTALNELKVELINIWSGRENTRRVSQKSRRWKTRARHYSNRYN